MSQALRQTGLVSGSAVMSVGVRALVNPTPAICLSCFISKSKKVYKAITTQTSTALQWNEKGGTVLPNRAKSVKRANGKAVHLLCNWLVLTILKVFYEF